MFEVLRLVSLALVWAATVLNVLGFCASIKSNKKWKQTMKFYEASIDEMRAARDKYLEAIEKLDLTAHENEL